MDLLPFLVKGLLITDHFSPVGQQIVPKIKKSLRPAVTNSPKHRRRKPNACPLQKCLNPATIHDVANFLEHVRQPQNADNLLVAGDQQGLMMADQ
jgi:hypothetical protein